MPGSLSLDQLTEAPVGRRGKVERSGRFLGLVGWALDPARPGEPLELDLLAGDIVVATCRTSLPRPDLGLGEAAAAAGFRIPHGTCQTRTAWDQRFSAIPLRLRIAGSGEVLTTALALPSLADWLAGVPMPEAASPALPPAPSFSQAADAAQGEPAPATPAPEPVPPTAEPAALAQAAPPGPGEGAAPLAATPRCLSAEVAARNLPAALAELRRCAEALPPPGDPPRQAGFIEAFGAVTGGPLWLFGWMHPTAGHHFPCRVGETELHPAGMAIAWQPRSDLPEGAVAFAAAADTAWRPAGAASRPRLIYGPEGTDHLNCLPSSQWLDEAACASRLAAFAAKLEGQFLKPLQRLSAATNAFVPDGPEAAALGLKAHVERLVVVPGFGALAVGWTLSPHSPLQPRVLRIGDRALPLVPGSLTQISRWDLLDASGGADWLVRTAGFIAAFAGPLEADEIGEATLKFVTGSGVGFGHRIGLAQLRVIGHSAAPDELLGLNAALPQESYFPALARALSAAQLRAATAVTPITPLPRAREAIIATLGPDRADAALLLAELGLRAAVEPTMPPVLLLLGNGDARALALAGFAELGIAGGLIGIADPGQALHALPAVLAAAGVERFIFLGPGSFPNAAGWRALLAQLPSPGDSPLSLPASFRLRDTGPDPGTAAFAWHTAGFLAWLAGRPAPLGGLASGALALPARWAAAPAAARPGRRVPPPRLAEAVNAVLFGDAALG